MSVRRSGAARASRVFDSQRDAVTFSKQVARNEGAEIYVHRPDGTIREKHAYGADAIPPKDKRQ